MTEPIIRALRPNDESEWRCLFAGYRSFYHLTADDAVVDRVWSWICDTHHETRALVAEYDGKVVGIAHYRPFARPSTGTTGLWLDDLFTDPSYRGQGVGRALIERLQSIAADRGCSVVRWITAEDNAQAQILYDTLASKTNWVTYDAKP